MPTHVSIRAQPMLDPRRALRRKPIGLAPRLSGLDGKMVLLFDNTQLTSQLANYGPSFRWLAQCLQCEYGATCAYRSQNLLKEPREGLVKLADEISRNGIDAVVIAICNAGIPQPSSNYVPGLPIVVAQRDAVTAASGYPSSVHICTYGIPRRSSSAANRGAPQSWAMVYRDPAHGKTRRCDASSGLRHIRRPVLEMEKRCLFSFPRRLFSVSFCWR